ncbi:MAG TPA: transporter, partial [Verrucomicrobiae bacterium]|nr:transporter [Verrucomicrobiae bacterium]
IPLLTLAVVFATVASAASASDTGSQDKSQYNLFNPTPADLLRPMNSDQYDGVLDAHTLDAGHVQIEGSLINYYEYSTHVYYPGVSYRYSIEQYSWAPRFRVGLLNNVDFEVNPSYTTRSYNDNGAFTLPYYSESFNITERSSGFGSIGLGPKINLWGNDGGPTSLAIHPFLSVPPRNGNILGGVGIPFGWQLPRGIYLKVETQFSIADDSSRTDYGEFYNSMSIHKSISKVDAYWYLDTTVTSNPAESWYGYTGFGAIYQLTRDLQLFAALGFGLQSGAFDYNPHFGIVWRY